MLRIALAYLATAVTFGAIDFIWLTRNIGFYRSEIGPMLADKPSMVPAVVFYLIYFFGIVYFAVVPAHNQSSWSSAAINGAVLGFVAYATYDLTNMATLRNWSLTLTLVDLGWGTFLTAIAAMAGYAAMRAIPS